MASSLSQGKAFRVFLNLSFLSLLFLFSTRLRSSFYPQQPTRLNAIQSSNTATGCGDIHGLDGSEAKCRHLIVSASECQPEGYIDYLHLFYCLCGASPFLGYTVLLLWLATLFYLLGNTAGTYFCSSLEGLSTLLRLSPTVAGVTLLSLGNSAPDVFSSIVSFTGSSATTSLVGLNSVLGGAFFVTSVVVGVISIFASRRRKIAIDKSCFVRDVCFLIFVLSVLLAILITGRTNLWVSAAYSSLYAVYVFLVSMTHICANESGGMPDFESDLGVPLLCNKISHEVKKAHCLSRILHVLELPLYLPRRLTIPDISDERWCKPFAVASVTLSPVFLVALWDSKRDASGSRDDTVLLFYLLGGLLGLVLGVMAIAYTVRERPPSRVLFPWLAGGFLMSVAWTYITADELVSLLVALGVILNVSPSILGLTVLAWGNSVGDLITNVAVAANGGSSGAQVAVSGCYGGPIFNILVGLGISFLLSSLSGDNSTVIPDDSTVFQTIGFFIAGLLWALVILPKRGMKLDRVLGIGLISIYLCFLCVSLGQSLGLIQLH